MNAKRLISLTFAVAIGAAAMTACSTPQADPEPVSTYPDGPITIIIPFPAGGITDTTSRLVAAELEAELGVPVIVENKEGGGGVTATTEFLQADPDGLTVLAMVSGPTTFRPATTELPYTWDSFTYMGSATSNPYALVVGPDSPWDTAQDLLDAVDDDPAAYDFATGAAIGPATFASGQLLQENGVDVSKVVYVTFDGDGASANAVAGGSVDFASVNPSTAIPLWEAGQLKILMQSGSVPLSALKDTPTADDEGIDGYTMSNFVGFLAPAGVPDDVVTAWEEALENISNDPEFAAKVENLGASIEYRTGAQLADYVKAEFETGRTIAEELGIEG
jgi:tripartite-type tricarboxylate transporter receptor subunit TctC